MGFRSNYWVWTSNGEKLPEMNRETFNGQTYIWLEINRDASRSQSHTKHHEKFNLVDDMISDSIGVNVTYDEPQDFDAEELSNEKALKFYQMLK